MSLLLRAFQSHGVGRFFHRGMSSALPTIVSTEWVASNLEKVRLIDASWYLPSHQRNPDKEYESIRLPKSKRFNIDVVKDVTSQLPHMLPPASFFEKAVGEMGISNGDHVVLYDSNGWSAQRSWWTFKTMGHDRLSIMEGGLGKWVFEKRPTESGDQLYSHPPVPYTANFRAEYVKNMSDMKANISSKQWQVVDARSRGRFHATEPEPRPGLRGGHIPGSKVLPFDELLQEHTEGAYKTYYPKEILQSKFQAAGIDITKPIITTCGSGVSASVLYFALYNLQPGLTLSLYDGSWTEWGAQKDTEIET
eukprot:TRINITY_DN9674_c0_g1_i1.p1 TRINITY_DN9674_c0_g1~~TRINITY_DN9674_c0_g1_i1.p1  ORF type:complete len:307 (+),score=43.97 TRINITY_DN9674_c0_g1_i1:79-999(+)